jgi:Tfp pilus assembly protein PilF
MATLSTKIEPMTMHPGHASQSPNLTRFMLPLTLVLTFVAYSGTLGYEFVYDDDDQIIGNRYLSSWSYLTRYFTEHSWSHRDFNLPGNYYRPFVLVWLRLNYSLLGLHPALWHLIAVLMYLGAVAAVYWLFRRLLHDKMTAGMAGMIFALYPLHIETAAWISGVTEPLLALLLIPSFLFYLNSREEGPGTRSAKIRWVAASLAFYAAALFTKETAIILPAMIVAYELICSDKRVSKEEPETNSPATRVKAFVSYAIKALVLIVPYMVVTLGYLVIRTIVLGGLLHTASRLPWTTRLLTVPSLLWGYVKLLVWPVGLSEFYDTPYVKSPGLLNFVLPLAAVVIAVIALWWAIRRVKNDRDRRTLAFACAWIVIPILPVLNIATFRPGDLIHDRYLFLPTIGVAILVACGLRKIRAGSGELAGLPAIQAVSALVLAGALGLGTAYQHVYWANDIVLFHHSLSVAPGNAIAQNAFGNALSTREMNDEAITVFENLVQQEPNNPTALYNLGYNFYKVGRYKDAVPYLATAIEINPKDERQFLTLGVTLFFLDRYDAAEGVLRQGIAVRRDGLGLHYALGAVLKQTGRLEEALNEFTQEVAYNPEYVSAYDQMTQIKQQMLTGTPQSAPPTSGAEAKPR